MRREILPLLLLLVVLFGCEKSENIEDHLYNTWQLEWKQCGIYQNIYNAQINFSQTDSTKIGWFKEQGADTIQFNLTVIDNENIQLESSDSIWNGNIVISEFQEGRLVFEKENKECDNELFKFE